MNYYEDEDVVTKDSIDCIDGLNWAGILLMVVLIIALQF